MGSKNRQRTSKLAQAGVNRRVPVKNTLSDAIRGVNAGLNDSLVALLKGGACSVALGTVVGSAMFVAPASQAQDAGTIEEVTIMGIRGSLKRALDLKRDADGIVDAISAEDMGKFPDTNLAESLQRITGVSIDRSRGEGSKITVRGLGPEFNLVLFNGRQMPTQSGGNRSFDFANIASEGVSAVEVYKSSNAKISTGGMGATVNVRTSRPLRDPGMSASASVKFVHDESTEAGNSLTPEISGIYSNTFADDRVGIAISASLQKRDSGLNTANVGPGWRAFLGTDTGPNTLPNNASQTNRPSGNDIYGVPQNTGYRIEEFQRERINGQLTLQWQPLDSVTGTIDYTYAELALSRQFSDLSAWYGGGGQITTYTDGPLASPAIYSEVPGQGDFAMAIGQDASINENNSLGFNLEWQATERLALALDYHDSEAESRPDSRFGTSANITLASYNRIGTRTWFDAGEIPVLQVDLDATGNPNGRGLDPETLQVSGSVFNNNLNRMDIEQTKLSGDFEINDMSSIDFGVQLTKIENRALSSNVQRNTWGQSPAAPGDISDLISPASIAGRFDELSGGNDPRLQTEYLTVSMSTLVDRIEELIAADPVNGLNNWSPGGGITNNFGDCGTGFCASTDYGSRTGTTEDTKSAYLQYNLSLDTAMPVDIHVGVRYEETEVESPASVPQINLVTWGSTNEFALGTGGANIDTVQTGEYDHVLPNFDISIDVFDDVKARFSYSESISRASFDQLKGGFSPSLLARTDGGSAGLGSPGINPLESTNFDISVEWYFTDESYFSVGYFKKEVDNFIGSTQLNDQLLYPGVTTPVGGAYWNAALASGCGGGGCAESDLVGIREHIFANFNGQPGVVADPANGPAAGTIQGIAGDPELLWRVSTNANLNAVDIDGWEVAVQHAFGDSGFGGIINATFVEASVGYDLNSLADQFVITGLSDSANLIGYYEKEGFQARIAYNWRDDFLNGVGHDTGAREPRITEAYAQWDFSASYEVDEFLSVFAEGINITNETTREHGRTKMQVLNASQGGARYNFGVRYKL